MLELFLRRAPDVSVRANAPNTQGLGVFNSISEKAEASLMTGVTAQRSFTAALMGILRRQGGRGPERGEAAKQRDEVVRPQRAGSACRNSRVRHLTP